MESQILWQLYLNKTVKDYKENGQLVTYSSKYSHIGGMVMLDMPWKISPVSKRLYYANSNINLFGGTKGEGGWRRGQDMIKNHATITDCWYQTGCTAGVLQGQACPI